MTNGELFRHCRAMLRPHRRLLGFVLVVNVASALTGGVGDPVFQKLLIDSLAGRRVEAFLAVALGFVAFATVIRFLGLASTLSTQRLKNRLSHDAALNAFGLFYRVPYARVAEHDRGYFVSRVFDEPHKASGEMVDVLVRLVGGVVTFAGALAVTVWLSWKAAAVLALVVPALLWLSRRFSRQITAETRRTSEEEAVLKDGLGRAVDAYRGVVLFGLHGAVRARVAGLLETYLETVYRRGGHVARFQTSSRVLLSYAELAVIVVAGVMVLRGELTIGGLFAFLTAYWRVVNGFSQITAQVPALAQLRGHLGRLDEFRAMAAAPATPDTADHIDLSGVRFGYGEAPVLEGATLRVPRGRRVLVRGPNGTGKSTLAHLATGLLRAQGGRQAVPELARVSALLLPAAFIPGTLAENADLGAMGDAARGRFLRLAGELGLVGKLDRDPATLSQGEQRRAQVLLALAKDADFYVLDEPLSNVDAEGREAVMRTVFHATRGRGLVVIMHGDDRFHDWFDEEVHLAAPSLPPEPELLDSADPLDADAPTNSAAEHEREPVPA
jgi:ABC-type multidrug transport system fused ATPase/permease subunit